jgi:hypothetical protein
VVLRVDSVARAYLLVAGGTGSEPRQHLEGPSICVRERTRYWYALQLTKTTWFTPSKVQVIPVAAVTRILGKTPPGLLLQLEALIPTDVTFGAG